MARRTTYGRPIQPLGVCTHCGLVGRVWEYGAESPGCQHYICATCIEVVVGIHNYEDPQVDGWEFTQ
jgi:hypothetical protein